MIQSNRYFSPLKVFGLKFPVFGLAAKLQMFNKHTRKPIHPLLSYLRNKSQTHTHFLTSKLGRKGNLGVYLDFYFCKRAFQHKFKFNMLSACHKNISYLAVSQKILLNTAVKPNDTKSENTQLSKNVP